MIVYRCEDSLESVFTAIYNAYEDRCDHRDTRLSLADEPLLFAQYRAVEVQMEKVRKVIRTLKRRFGEEDYERLCLCLTAPDDGKAQAVYQTVVKGLAAGCGPGHLFDALADADVHKAFSLGRGAWRELHHFYGFLRFQELEQGGSFSAVRPKNNLMTFLMPHFADRLPGESFVILDKGRGLFGVHPAGKEWFLVRGESAPEGRAREMNAAQERNGARIFKEGLRPSGEERAMQELFRYFCHTITIEERENPKLQRNLLPFRFREDMVEFDKNQQTF